MKKKSENWPFFSAIGKFHLQTKLTDLIIKLSRGYIKTETQAIYVLLAIVALIFIISFIIFLTAGSSFPEYPEGVEIEPVHTNTIF